MTIGVQVAAGALIEMGYQETADRVMPNRKGAPTIRQLDRGGAPHHIIVKAFLLGHLAMGHDARLIEHPNAIRCVTCWPELLDET